MIVVINYENAMFDRQCFVVERAEDWCLMRGRSLLELDVGEGTTLF